VVGLTRPGHGSWAELAKADARQLVELPEDIGADAALGLHVNAQTAWFCLYRGARVQAGETVLVHAAAGGVGSMTVQIALDAGATVIATSSPGKRDVVEALGPHLWLDNRDAGWPDAVRAFRPDGVDVVVDVVGGAVFDQSWKLLAFEGRMVTAGFTSAEMPVVKANHAMVKNVSLIGIYWSRYTLEATPMTREAAIQIWELHRRGSLDPLVTVRDTIPNALDRNGDLAGGRTTGKVVLSW
jgi:NADPH2:quinone reductase